MAVLTMTPRVMTRPGRTQQSKETVQALWASPARAWSSACTKQLILSWRQAKFFQSINSPSLTVESLTTLLLQSTTHPRRAGRLQLRCRGMPAGGNSTNARSQGPGIASLDGVLYHCSGPDARDYIIMGMMNIWGQTPKFRW